jgi:ketosteroid isomerase-like protein
VAGPVIPADGSSEFGDPMKYLVLIFLLFVVWSSPQAAAPNAEREIRDLEEHLNNAFNTIDAKAIDGIWSDDFVFVAPSGRIANKVERMAGLKPAAAPKPPLVSALNDVQIRVYGASAVAIVKSTWSGTVDAKSFADSFVATHVWIRAGESWRLVSAHVSQVQSKS